MQPTYRDELLRLLDAPDMHQQVLKCLSSLLAAKSVRRHLVTNQAVTVNDTACQLRAAELHAAYVLGSSVKQVVRKVRKKRKSI